MAPQHVPFRQCVFCRTRAPQRDLVRFVRAGDGWSYDVARRQPGRGAYLCSAACAQRVRKHKRFGGLADAAAAVAWPGAPGLCEDVPGVYDRAVPP